MHCMANEIERPSGDWTGLDWPDGLMFLNTYMSTIIPVSKT
jgi:hypothetical protein